MYCTIISSGQTSPPTPQNDYGHPLLFCNEAHLERLGARSVAFVLTALKLTLAEPCKDLRDIFFFIASIRPLSSAVCLIILTSLAASQNLTGWMSLQLNIFTFAYNDTLIQGLVIPGISLKTSAVPYIALHG